ncbi:MAG: hypothetical protein FJX33_15590 [Alphaproteobacteria bacterium]|nr:hypothetical protein [Alphaproteobacteria bacterium]
MRAAMQEAPAATLHWDLGGPWLVLAAAALALPRALYGVVTGEAPGGLWSTSAIAPVLAGLVFALFWARNF